jgi:GalNAc-alpha-(1->4)-GalNAc-alpha-(1->3)-diNAcBac-PP-undecaprenol alpha-1,4-N-acetyl-D-galactosaminyltransferase
MYFIINNKKTFTNNNNYDYIILSPSFKTGGAEKIAQLLKNEFLRINKSVLFIVYNYSHKDDHKVKIVGDIFVMNSNSNYLKLKQIRKLVKKYHNANWISGSREISIKLSLAIMGITLKNLVCRESNTYDSLNELPIIKQNISRLALNNIYRKASKIIANSPRTLSDLIGKFPFVKNKSIFCYNPVFEFGYKNELKTYNQKETLKFVAVSNFKYQKNLPLMLNGFARYIKNYPKDKLTIYGHGPLKQTISVIIDSLNLTKNVTLDHFTGNMAKKLNDYDIFLHTAHYEGFGNAIVEAMSVNLPIVCSTKVGMVSEFKNHYEHWIDTKNCEEEFSQKCEEARKLVNSPNVVRSNYYEQFTVDKIIVNYM